VIPTTPAIQFDDLCLFFAGMIRWFSAILLAFIFPLSFSAQAPVNAIGLRGGWGTGVTFQHHLSDDRVVEILLNSRWRGYSLTGLYEVHKPLSDIEGVRWYYGVGAHIGFWSYYEDGPKWHNDEWQGKRSIIGADGILGIEYFFDEIPFQVSLDWKPAINLIGYSGFWGDEGALSIRYTF
jgi:hypothetical protein